MQYMLQIAGIQEGRLPLLPQCGTLQKPTCAATLLVEAFQGASSIPVHHPAHISLVNAHAKRSSGHNDVHGAISPIRLCVVPCFAVLACIEGQQIVS